jgi:hypothetical protein
MAMNNSLVDDKNGPNNMRRKPTKEMAPESKTKSKKNTVGHIVTDFWIL